ncbi:immunoglobulin superfamily containing leucine-rich repeat protein 2 [Eucyclogobius newberryi]|uniref:immunoglobulin superfamily containing leucine-rich repeat protein 2 n=1 Tax=Eucyclogobius newberryi TaxID=166745 RepID=UPI003B594E60
MEKMSMRIVRLLAVWALVIAVAQCCPQPCTCVDKAAQNLANCAYKELLEVPTALPPNITTLSLSANKIKLLKSKSFVNVTQVNSLWLANNVIVTIERDTLAPLVQLRNLDISYNKIINFPWEDLQNLTALQLLKMNHNEMVSLPKDAFSTLADLRSLRINNNKFTTIVQGTFSTLSSLAHLQIFNNPFSCSCAVEWLRDWITTTRITVPEPNNIVCDSPAHLNGTMVTNMPKLSCKAPIVTITYQPDLESTELSEGASVVLTCEAQGIPLPQLVWELTTASQNYLFPLPSNGVNNDKPINDKATNSQFHVFQNGTLNIPRMSKRVEGNYSCSATNDMGRAQSSVRVALASQKYINKPAPDSTDNLPSVSKPITPKLSKNNVINWSKNDERTKSDDATSDKHGMEQAGGKPKEPALGSKCGVKDGSEYISNHAFNMTLDDLKQYTFDFGVIALEVSETEAKVQLNPLQLPNSKTNLHLSPGDHLDTVNKEPIRVFESSGTKSPLDMLYLCVDTGNGHSIVQWSKIDDRVNSYRFHHLHPGTNYTLCLTYGGQDCQVQVVFTTRKKIPSLLIIVVVSIFLLALATVPLLGATCCHLLYKYQGKTYKLIMKAQNPDQMEKQMATDFDSRASFVGSEKNFNPSEIGDEEEGEPEDADREGEAEDSVVTESIPGSSSKTNPEEFEVGSEYSDRLPLGAEAVTISEEINGNYKEPSR